MARHHVKDNMIETHKDFDKTHTHEMLPVRHHGRPLDSFANACHAAHANTTCVRWAKMAGEDEALVRRASTCNEHGKQLVVGNVVAYEKKAGQDCAEAHVDASTARRLVPVACEVSTTGLTPDPRTCLCHGDLGFGFEPLSVDDDHATHLVVRGR
jgi:hypothetical protein